MNVCDIFDRHPMTTSPDEPAQALWGRMQRGGADHAVVLEHDQVAGIISRHDLMGPAGGARRRMGRSVGELMRRDVSTTTPTTSVRRAAASMRRRHVGCLPVVTRKQLVGILTVSQLLRVLEQKLAGG
jgi:CBS domain-containing protein